MSQDDLARAIRQAGQRVGEPNSCTKRVVQRWEAGQVKTPRGAYARVLEYVTGQPLENLGFKPADEKYGVDRDQALAMAGASWIPLEDPKAQGPLTGIWRSTYVYPSSSRGADFTSEHFVILLQRGDKLQVRSVPASASKVMIELTVNGQVATGTWVESTDPHGFYQGSIYSGGIQFLIDPTGRRMTGKWLGFGRDFDINTGPWTLQLVSSDTGTDAMRQYNKQPEPVSAS